MTKKLQVTFAISEKMNETCEFYLPSHVKSVKKIWVIENNKPCQPPFFEKQTTTQGLGSSKT